MRFISRAGVVAATALTTVAMAAGPAAAHWCVNPDKRAGAGAQILIQVAMGGGEDNIVFLTEGMEKRFESGVTTEETFRGLIGLDFDWDGKADMTTWIVGKYGEIPMVAQRNGAECHGVLNVEDWFACMEAAG